MSIKKRKKHSCTVSVCCANVWWRKDSRAWDLQAPSPTLLPPSFHLASPASASSSACLPLFSLVLSSHLTTCVSLFPLFCSSLSFFLSPLDSPHSLSPDLMEIDLCSPFRMTQLSLSLPNTSLCLPNYIPKVPLPGSPPLNLAVMTFIFLNEPPSRSYFTKRILDSEC